MRKAIFLLGAMLLTATLLAAQSGSGSHFAPPTASQDAAKATLPTSSDLRGCLTGSKGHYTLTDHQGKQHQVSGDDHALLEETGHEVDLAGSSAGNTFQEKSITDIASRCWNFSLN